jgi:hypothetical protein
MAGNDKSDVFKHYDMQTNRPDGCWIWSGAVGGRKSEPRPYFQAGGRRYLAYRLVFELVKGVELRSDQLLLHSCDNGSMPVGCGNPAHLSIGTVQDNSDDMTSRQRHGVNHHVVKGIRKLLADGKTQQVIADLYGISREAVSAIATERSHSHVKRTDD